MIRREFISLARSYYQEGRVGEIWKGDILIGDVEDLENWTQQIFILEESTPKHTKNDEFEQMVQQHCWLGAANRRTHSGAGTDRKGRTNRWRWSPCRHLVDPRWLQLSSSQWTSSFNSTCRRKKHSFFWEYIDVTRSTHTDLDVLQEKRIDDYWNVVRAEVCQILGQDFQSSLDWKKKPPQGYMWSGRRMTKIHTKTKPRLWSGSIDENW